MLKLEWGGVRGWRLNEVFERHAMRRAKRVVAVSGQVREELVRLYGVGRERIMVLDNCVDTSVFCPAEPEENCRDGRLTILYSGRLEEMKGLRELLRLAEVIERPEDCGAAGGSILLLIATQEERNVDLFGRFRRTEVLRGISMEEMAAFYRRGDVFYFPSKYEGASLSCLEALSCGLPVVGSGAGCLPELGEKLPEAVMRDRGGGGEETLKQLIRAGISFRDYHKRRGLHGYIQEHYGMKLYRQRIRRALGLG